MALAALSAFSSVGGSGATAAPAAAPSPPPNGHACNPGHSSSALPFCNVSLPIEARVADLVGRMTAEEKVHLIAIRGDSNNTGVDRLGIPGYNWGIEILHGAGIACIDSHCPTILPVLANAAASFNRSAWHGMGAVISTEMRAANNANGITRPGSTDPVGVNGWGPNINLLRDPRWGRALEVPTEDPRLAGHLAAAMTHGIQEGEDPRYVKLLGALKHFTVYSMEHSDGSDRGGFSPTISKHDMADSYLPAYQIGIQQGKSLGMMCSYTTVNGTAMCESHQWQQKWARQKLGFQGNIVTDCTALNMAAPSPEHSMDAAHNAAAGLKAGTDLNCGNGWDGKAHGYTAATDAVRLGLATQAELDTVVGRSLGLLMRTGLFDPLDKQIYTKIGVEQLGAPEHLALAEEVAAQGLVLLKSPQGVLPLQKGKRTAVIGPHANAHRQLLGSYFTMACPLPKSCPRSFDPSTHNSSNSDVCPHGSANYPCPGDSSHCMLDWSCVTSPADAIAAVGGTGASTTSAMGCKNGVDCVDDSLFAEAIRVAQAADQLVVMLGISANIESEGRDRSNTTLPGLQEELALKLLALGKPTVVVLLNGGIVSTDRLAMASSKCALVEAFNPGIRGAEALAKSLFGEPGYNRFGKLPVTIYDSSFSDSVEMIDMSFTAGLGRSYKYWTGPPPLFEFGHGLSLTTFALSWAGDQPPATAVVTAASIGTELITVQVVLKNTGTREGDEVLMLYHVPGRDLKRPPQERSLRLPHRRLIDFERVSLGAGQARHAIEFQINATSLGLVDTEGNTYLYAGSHQLRVDTSPDSATAHMSGGSVNSLTMSVTVGLADGPLLIDTLL